MWFLLQWYWLSSCKKLTIQNISVVSVQLAVLTKQANCRVRVNANSTVLCFNKANKPGYLEVPVTFYAGFWRLKPKDHQILNFQLHNPVISEMRNDFGDMANQL